MEFPRFVYRAPGPCKYSGGARYGFVVVNSIEEYDAHLAQDYHATPREAIAAAGEPAFTAHLNKRQLKAVAKAKPWLRLQAPQKPLQPLLSAEEVSALIAPISQAPVPADDVPPTRSELEQKAIELGVKFDGRTTDAALLRRINSVLKEPV
jgi:hypothetical protein